MLVGRRIKEMLTNFSAQSPDAARIAGIYSPLVGSMFPIKKVL